MTELVRIVRSRSSRGGARPKLIVLHTTESHNRPGVEDLLSLADWFDTAPASSHKAVDRSGNVITLVPDDEEAWTQCYFNPVSLSIEQVGFSAYDRAHWIRDYHLGLRAVARELARWHLRHGIPLRHSTRLGVCQHKHLLSVGCGHADCGPDYPEKYVTYWARLWASRLSEGVAHRRTAQAAFYDRWLRRQQRRYAGRVLGTE